MLRIGLGFILIGDTLVRLTDVEAFYSNQGWLPLSTLHHSFFDQYSWSLNAINGSVLWQVLLMILALVSAVCMILGFNTRCATLISWVLLVSIQNRNILVLQGGDDVLRIVLFWAMLMPLSRVWSVDALYAKNKVKEFNYDGIENLGYILLIFSMYFFSALLKYSPEWYSEGTALYYAFSLDQLSYPMSKLLYPHAQLLKILTFIVLGIELLVPILLLIPYKIQTLRVLFLICIWSLHLGIALTLQVGYFFLISIVITFALLPGQWLDDMQCKFKKILPLFTLSLKPKHIIELPKHWRIGLAAFGIMISLAWNIGNLIPYSPRVWSVLHPFGIPIGLNQNWGMFAPTVFKNDGWYIYRGYQDSTKVIDLLRPADTLSYEKPRYPVYQYKNAKWRKLGENLLNPAHKEVLLPFCLYQLFRHNDRHPEQKIKRLEVIYMQEVSQPNYIVPQPDTLNICNCQINEG